MKDKINFETIYAEYFEIVYKYLYCLTKNSDMAEELTQETFYKAILKIDTFKNQSKISSWLCQIAKNLWYNELKRKRKISIDDSDIFTQIRSNENIENDFIRTEEEQELEWSRVNKEDYLLAMERSSIKDVEIKELLKKALTDKINDREVYMKGIDASYHYEGYTTYRTEEL